MFGSEGAPGFAGGIDLWVALGRCDGFFNLGRGFGLPAFDVCGSGPIIFEKFFARDGHAIAAEFGAFQFGGDVTGVIMFAMAAEAEQVCHDQLRAAAGAGTFDSAADRAQAIFEVGAVHNVALDAVTDGAIDEGCARELPGFGRGVGVLIVGDDQDQRKFFYSGLIDSLVTGAGAGAAFANRRGPDRAIFSFKAMSHERAVNDGNHCAEMADHWEIAVARFAAVDVAVAGAHGAERRAEAGANGFEGSFAESKPAGAVADERGENVAFTE